MSLLAAAFNSERFEQMELAPMTWRRLPGGNEPLLRAKREELPLPLLGTIGPLYELVVGAGAVHGSRISCWWCAATPREPAPAPMQFGHYTFITPYLQPPSRKAQA